MSEHKPRPAAVDAVIVRDGKILLIKRRKEPYFGKWAVPGGFIEWNETAEEAVVRETREETGVLVRPTRITGVYSSPKRDPRQTVATAFLCEYVSGEPKGGDDAEEAKWWPLSKLPELAFDHKKIISDALRLV